MILNEGDFDFGRIYIAPQRQNPDLRGFRDSTSCRCRCPNS